MSSSGDLQGKAPVLRREVELPSREPTGLGLMLVASAAMFFAVAGSAFVVRARLAEHAHEDIHRLARPLVAPPTVRVQDTNMVCGQPIVYRNPDGTESVDYVRCDEAPSIVPAPPAEPRR